MNKLAITLVLLTCGSALAQGQQPAGTCTNGDVLKYSTTDTREIICTPKPPNLSNVDNTTDLNKPISTATQSALDAKASSSAATTVNGTTCTLGSTCTVTDSTKVPTSTTVNGHALSSNATVTASDLSLGNLTNDVQTKASVVPNTTPSAGQILAGNAGGTAYTPVTVSGSGATVTMSSAGVITLSAIPNATLSNSGITVNTTSPITGGATPALGGSVTVACATCVTGVTGTAPIASSGGTTPAISLSGIFGTNAQTATYQVLAADFTSYKTIIVASGTFTITLVASGSQPATGQFIRVINYGSGVVTVARSGQNINGGTTSITLNAASATAPTSTTVTSDGTNYFATIDEATVGSVTSIATTSPVGGGTITGSGTITCTTCATTTNGGALSGTSPIAVSAAGAISCTTCATTTNGGALSGTSPVTVSAAGAIACATCITTASGQVLNQPTIGISGTSGSTHVNNIGTAPTCSGTGGGTSPTACAVDTGSTDRFGTMTISTGSGSPSNTSTVTLTFNSSLGTNAAVCLCQLKTGATAWSIGSTIVQSTDSKTAPVFTWQSSTAIATVALTASTTYKINYHCEGI